MDVRRRAAKQSGGSGEEDVLCHTLHRTFYIDGVVGWVRQHGGNKLQHPPNKMLRPGVPTTELLLLFLCEVRQGELLDARFMLTGT